MTLLQSARKSRRPVEPVRRGDLPAGQARAGHHPSIALTVISLAQLMVVLDATIVNVALPKIQGALGFSPTGLSWVLNAYTLTFGGLLLLGARAGDILGRRRLLIGGVLLFTAASFAGGFATSSGWLLVARALQGVGGAAASPSALALLTSNFEEGRERTRALGLYTAVSVAGSGVGLVAGGMLTAWVSWRWVLFVNVPVGIAIALLAPRYLNESQRHPGRFDLAGAITSTLGMTGLVYGFIRAATAGWLDTGTLVSFAAGVGLLAAFVFGETRVAQPITPLRLFADRNRAGAYVARLFFVGGMTGMFFFLTQFLQDVTGFSSLRTGFAFLPVTAMLMLASQVTAQRLVGRVGTKPLMVVGAAVAALGMFWLSRISPSTSYAGGILGPLVLFGLGGGTAFVPLTMAALADVKPADAGAASGMVNAVQQVGGALGLAILVTVFGTASRHAQAHPVVGAVAQAHHVMSYGAEHAFVVAAVFMLATALVALFVSRRRREVMTVPDVIEIGPAVEM